MNATTPAARERITLLREELSEVTIEISKIERFGLDSYHPSEPHIPNSIRLSRELGDLLGIIDMMSSQDDIDSRVINHSAHMIAHRIFTGKTSNQDHTSVESELIAALRDTKIPDRDHQGQTPSGEHLLNILHATIAQTQAVLSPIPTISEDIRKKRLTAAITSLLWVIDNMIRVHILDHKTLSQYRHEKAGRIAKLPNLQGG